MMSEGTTEKRHAHEVMEMMITSGKTYSRESLLEDIRSKFGVNVVFDSCSANGLTPDQLIDFLGSKGKLRGTEDAFSFASAQMCHGH